MIDNSDTLGGRNVADKHRYKHTEIGKIRFIYHRRDGEWDWEWEWEYYHLRMLYP